MRSTVYLKTTPLYYMYLLHCNFCRKSIKHFGLVLWKEFIKNWIIYKKCHTLQWDNAKTHIPVVKSDVFLIIQIKVTMNSISPSKFPTMCFTQSSVSSGTVARLLWRGRYTKVSGLFTTKSWNKWGDSCCC